MAAAWTTASAPRTTEKASPAPARSAWQQSAARGGGGGRAGGGPPGPHPLKDRRREVRSPDVVARLLKRCHRRPPDLAPSTRYQYPHDLPPPRIRRGGRDNTPP